MCGTNNIGTKFWQTVVLMLFNDAQSLTFQEIKDASAIEDKELRRTLQSLACGKVRVLNKVCSTTPVQSVLYYSHSEKFLLNNTSISN